MTKYKLEDGHFELDKKADETLLTAIETGTKADVKKYYLDKAKKELDEKFDDEFEKEFTDKFNTEFEEKFKEEFNSEFQSKFDEQFESMFKQQFDANFGAQFDIQFGAQVKQTLFAQGLDESSADAMLAGAIAQQNRTELIRVLMIPPTKRHIRVPMTQQKKENYQSAYDTAYKEAYQSAHDEAYDTAYQEAYDEAYPEAYDEAWDKIVEEIDDKYADAEEKYELNDPDFTEVPVKVYENFFRNEEEDYNNDGEAEGNIRVYAKNDNVDLACLLDGAFPEKADEIAIDRMHADNVGVKVGDEISVSGQRFKVVGLIAYVNYATLHEKSTDMMFDAIKFDVAMVTQEGFDSLHKTVHYSYTWNYVDIPADEVEQKAKSDDFMKALLTQVVCDDKELEDYMPRYANPAINFATDDMGSDKAMGGVLLDILIVIIAFIFAVTISNTIVKEASTIGTLRASGYTRGELVRHYISMPVIVTLLAACVGNILGYTVFKNVVVGMYYNSYSLPTYQTVWNPDAFFKTTIIPVVLMLAVNLVVIIKMMRHTPLQFLRHDLKKTKRKKAMRLPKWSFLSRFRLRIMFQNVTNYLILFVGIWFIGIMLAMAVGMPETLDYYKSNVSDMMFTNYQYVLSLMRMRMETLSQRIIRMQRNSI